MLNNRRFLIILLKGTPSKHRPDFHWVAALFALTFTAVAMGVVLWAPLPRAHLMVSLAAGIAGSAALAALAGSRPNG